MFKIDSLQIIINYLAIKDKIPASKQKLNRSILGNIPTLTSHLPTVNKSYIFCHFNVLYCSLFFIKPNIHHNVSKNYIIDFVSLVWFFTSPTKDKFSVHFEE